MREVERAKQTNGVLAALKRSPALGVGAGLLALVVLVGVAVPLLSPYAPDQIIPAARLLPPGPGHILGTDALGRDLLTRIAYGAHLAARMAFLSVALALGIGLCLGSVAGFYGGWIDQIIARAMDAWLALPGALVAIVIVARLGPSLDNLILALGLMGVPSFFRVVRASTLGARRALYVEAAVALGASDARVMWRHVFPNIVSPVVVLTTLRLGTALLTGSSLSFIGLGAQPPLPEWGALLATGRSYLGTAWWLGVFPGLAVAVTVVALNFVGDGLRDILDPHGPRGKGDAEAPADAAAKANRPAVSAAPVELTPRQRGPHGIPNRATVGVTYEESGGER
jgi:ABC-type dipeptide/oligopeptide/nickel transport system permease subunit